MTYPGTESLYVIILIPFSSEPPQRKMDIFSSIFECLCLEFSTHYRIYINTTRTPLEGSGKFKWKSVINHRATPEQMSGLTLTSWFSVQ